MPKFKVNDKVIILINKGLRCEKFIFIEILTCTNYSYIVIVNSKIDMFSEHFIDANGRLATEQEVVLYG